MTVDHLIKIRQARQQSSMRTIVLLLHWSQTVELCHSISRKYTYLSCGQLKLLKEYYRMYRQKIDSTIMFCAIFVSFGWSFWIAYYAMIVNRYIQQSHRLSIAHKSTTKTRFCFLSDRSHSSYRLITRIVHLSRSPKVNVTIAINTCKLSKILW